MICEYCGKEINDGNTFCQNCGAKINAEATRPVMKLPDTTSSFDGEKNNEKIPFYKQWWFWVLMAVLFLVMIGIIGGGDKPASSTSTTTVKTTSNVKAEATTTAPTETFTTQASVPREYQNALKKAETYSDMMHMSKKGIYEQLISEYGENFSKEAAQYAIDNLKADYKVNALEKGKIYYETMNMSKKAVYDQLISEYGEQFTKEEAQYAIDNLPD